jgi:hypothetical protein
MGGMITHHEVPLQLHLEQLHSPVILMSGLTEVFQKVRRIDFIFQLGLVEYDGKFEADTSRRGNSGS